MSEIAMETYIGPAMELICLYSHCLVWSCNWDNTTLPFL